MVELFTLTILCRIQIKKLLILDVFHLFCLKIIHLVGIWPILKEMLSVYVVGTQRNDAKQSKESDVHGSADVEMLQMEIVNCTFT